MPCYQESFQSCNNPAAPKRHPKASAPLSFPVILGVVVGQTVQDEDLPPLCALIQSCQQFVDVLRIQIQQVAVRVGLTDLRQRGHSICHHLGEKNSLLAEPEELGRDRSRAGYTWGGKLQVCQLSEPSGMQHNPTTNLQSPELPWQEQGAGTRTSQETWPWKELEMASPGNSTSLQAPPAPGDAQLHSQGAQTSSCPIFSGMCASCPISPRHMA